MRKHGGRGVLGLLVTVALIAGMNPGARAAAPPTEEEQVVPTARVTSVPGSDHKVKPRKPDLDVDTVKTPSVVWPTTGSAEVTLPAVSRPTGALPKKAAGVLPVSVGQAKADGSAPSRVKVELLARQGSSLPVRLTSADKAKAASKVALELDYQAFRAAYGGDWATRLRLVQLPSRTPLKTHNTGSGKLTAEVPATGLYAMEAAAGGPAGDFGASTLSPSASWSIGGSSGDFNWQYPMRTPPATGGPTPTISLGYSSGSVDGRTSATNNQTSWAGEGFELSPGGSIERRYASCAAKSEKTGNNGNKAVGDLCFATDNATFSLNGKGGELVLDDKTKQWHPKADDGTKVERLHGTDNGDHGGVEAERGEYWVITEKDGTKFYFGLNKLPGQGVAETNSTFTVPVAGNHSGEQCHQAAFANSFCDQAYRWNLDYVVDPHGNTMSLYYDTEQNKYAANGTETTLKSYDRAGNIKRIDYGQTAADLATEKAVARVHFDTTERCLAGSGCAPADYLDSPLDQDCADKTRCNQFGPTFWTKKKLSKVRTEVRRGTGFETVDTWTLRHTFPNPADNTSERLWLEAISHTGEAGPGAVVVPEVNFDKVAMNNRVADGSARPALDWFRIGAIHYGTGGELAIKYYEKDCQSTAGLPPVDRNDRRCYPMKWTPPGETEEREDWFHKYVVEKVTESDRVTGMEPVVTTVVYPEAPAWRHDDEDGLVEIGRKTWSQWRGYDKVITTKGSGAVRTVTENRFFRGMDGDKSLDGRPKEVRVEDSTGQLVEDADVFAGRERESRKLVGEAVVERTVTDSWQSPATSTRVRDWGTTSAFKVEQKRVRQWETKPAGGFRQTSSTHEYSPAGELVASSNVNDLATTDDDTCTRYEYVNNPALGIYQLPVRTQIVAKACGQPWTTDDVLSDQKQAYPGGAAPENAKPTTTHRLSGFTATGAPTYETVKTTAYDDHGRKKSETDAANQTTTYGYLPADGPVTKTTVRLPNGHESSTELDPAWGQATAIVDVAGRRTVSERDGLGRIARVWLPGRAASETPNVEHTYLAGVDQPGVVRTEELQADGTRATSYEILDGLQRKRQIQKTAADGIGRVITDVEYDSRGLEVIENEAYYNTAAPGPVAFDPVEEQLPARKAVQYDAVERPVREAFWSKNEEKWATTHSFEPDRQTVDPPDGEQATTKITDAQGRLTELRTYNTPAPGGDFDRTSYTYNKTGQLETVTDPAGNVWRYDYDLRGRKIRTVEPDRGETTYTYNKLDQVSSSTDARGRKLFYGYDELGRQKTVRENVADGPLRVERTYDTLAKGSPSSATRYVAGAAYTTRVTGYGPGGQPLGTEVTIPGTQGGLATTYRLENTYTATGQPETLKVPAVGGLPAETLKTTYDTDDLPTALSSEVGTYVTGAQFNSYGDLTNLEVKPSNGKWLRHTYVYDDATRRLTQATIQRQTTGPQRILHQTYGYDHSGNVVRIDDEPAATSTDPKDTQCFDYDESRRLTQAWTPADGNCGTRPTSAAQLGGPAPYWHQWTFDKIGNRKTEKRMTTEGATTSTYEYPAAGQARPHAVQKITTTGPDGTSRVNEYGYDDAGNQISRKLAGTGETFEWDAEGKLAGVTNGSKKTEYIYDADGNRLLRKDHTGTTLYLGTTEVLLMPDGSQLGTRHYQFGKQTIGVRVGTKLTWLGSDHHGSATLSVDAETQAYQRKRITPYGETRGPVPAAWPGQKDFVGGTRDDSTGLVELGARQYDPTTGRFVSVDPVVDPEDPQQLNAYSYANNSPASFVDADGKRYVTITTQKTIIREHVRRITELQKVVTYIRVLTPILVFFGKLAAALGLHELARGIVAEVQRQVTRWKEVQKTIRYHTKEILRIVTKRFLKESGRDAGEMRRALDQAKQLSNSVSEMDKSMDRLADVAAAVGERAKSAEIDAEVNRRMAAAMEKHKERSGFEWWGAGIGRGLGGYAATLAGVWAGAKLGAICGPAAVVCSIAGGIAGGFVGADLGERYYEYRERLKRAPRPITPAEHHKLCATWGASEACKYASPR